MNLHEKKHFPDAMPKKKFQALYKNMPERLFRDNLTVIIKENRKSLSTYRANPQKIHLTKTVFKNEMHEFAETFGWPDEYQPEN